MVHQFKTLTTIHIQGDISEGKLLKDLYKQFLKDDPLWHFVLWSNFRLGKRYFEGSHILVRVSEPEIAGKVREYLDSMHVIYEEYDYPFPKPRRRGWLGLIKKSWEVKYQDIALLMDHLCAEAAMQMNDKEWRKFVGQFVHIAHNARGKDHYAEGVFHLNGVHGAMYILGEQRNLAVVENALRRQRG